LADGDYDGAVNRSYYAMFDIARAALLRAGVTEDRLPRTHHGVIELFRQHAVQSERIDRELGAELSRTESHRIKADYTGIEIQPEIAAEAVATAELFVQAVERAFVLDESSLGVEYENDNPRPDDKVSETVPSSTIGGKDGDLQPISFEETRRQARENWLRLRQQNLQRGTASNNEGVKERGVEDHQSHSFDDDRDG